jgi:hypothetical protein
MKKVKPASDKYVLTIEPGLYNIKGFGDIDLRSLTLDHANALYKQNFPYLEFKPKASNADGPDTKPISSPK